MGRAQRRVRIALIGLVLVPLVVLAALDWRLSSALTRIDGAFAGLEDRPPAATDGSVTMLMLGTGQGRANSPTLAWMPDDPTVVSALLVTISGDRLSSRVDWLPLGDSILDGVADTRPSSSVAAVEAWTGQRVDHLAVVDWAAFSELGQDNGVPLELAPGAGRADQQAVLRQVLDESLHTSMRKKPWLLYRAMHTMASGMAVEQGWSTVDMHVLAISLRDLRSASIVFGVAGPGVPKMGE